MGPLDYTDGLIVSLAWITALSLLGAALALIADRPWHAPRHRDEPAPKLPPVRSLARRTVGGGGAARSAGPGGAPNTAAITMPHARPYVDPPQISGHATTEVLPVDASAPPRGDVHESILAELWAYRSASCGLCHDGRETIGTHCIFCGAPARDQAGAA
jgi:hypothetical protein